MILHLIQHKSAKHSNKRYIDVMSLRTMFVLQLSLENHKLATILGMICIGPLIKNERRKKHIHSTGYIQRSCSLMKVDFLWNVSCFLSPSFLGFLQQRLAAGPSTGHQLVSQQSMMRPISRRLKIPKSLSPVLGPASELYAHGVTEKSR